MIKVFYSEFWKSIIKKSFVHLILIALIGFLSYLNTFNVPFQWDEYPFIVDNPIVKDLSYFLEPSKARGFEYYSALKSRYIGYLTFALNYKLHGLDVRGYHVFNISIHILNAWLIYFFVMLTFRTPFLNPPLLPPLSKGGLRGVIALFSALLFVSHPVQTEAVTYIFQRFASLATFFYLLSIVLYIKWRLTPPSPPFGKGGMGGLLYLLSLLSAVLAMKTKENALTLPIVIMLYEFFFFKGSVWKRILYLAPFLLTMLIIPLSLIGIDKPVGEMISGIESATRGYSDISRWDYLLTQSRVVVTYIRLLFLPINQNFGYDYPVFQSFFIPEILLSFLFLFSIFGIAVYLFYRSQSLPDLRVIAFGVFWFFITLSVESSIISIPMWINEYRVYLPSAGAFIAMSAGAVLLSDKLKKRNFRIIAFLFFSLILFVLSYAGYMRNSVWGSKISLWEDTVRKSPMKATAHNILALAYSSEGLTDKAIEHFQSALRLEPFYAEAHNNLGIAFYKKGLTDKAIEHFQAALKLKPDYEEIHNNLGNAHYKKGLTDKAIEHFQAALKLKPDYAAAHFNLGLLYLDIGAEAKAYKEFEETLQINPDFHQAKKYLINKTLSP